MGDKIRLDQLLVDKGIYESREKAKRAIMAGEVLIDDVVFDKAGTKVSPLCKIRTTGKKLKYVGRGGLKLEKALKFFDLDLTQKVVMDVGASTGGFTDCALQNGAKKVYAVDVGYGQLAWKLRQDARVIVMERTNARYLKKEDINELLDFITIDVSFISLTKILPALIPLLDEDGEIVTLVKPQFEAGREGVGKHGIVRDANVQKDVLIDIMSFAQKLQLNIKGLTYSPIKGGSGNIEFLLYLTKKENNFSVTKDLLDKIIKKAHEEL